MTEKYSPQKHEWGTDASNKYARDLTPGQGQENLDPGKLPKKKKKQVNEFVARAKAAQYAAPAAATAGKAMGMDAAMKATAAGINTAGGKFAAGLGKAMAAAKGAALSSVAPYAAAGLAAYGAKKGVQYAMKRRRDQKIADKAAERALSKMRSQHKTANKKNPTRTKQSRKSVQRGTRRVKSFREHLDVFEATYKGKDVPLNKPMKGDVKKSKVYVKDPKTGNVKKVNFGDKNMSIKKDQPGRKKSYCARSAGIEGGGKDKTKANYWSRKAWDC